MNVANTLKAATSLTVKPARRRRRPKSKQLLNDSGTIFLSSSYPSSSIIRAESKIAFMFLTRGPMPFEDIWHEFFTWRTSSNLYSIYIHTAYPGFTFPPTSIFHKKEVRPNWRIRFGNLSQVLAIQLLIRAALRDPLNLWFTLLSESCIPLIPFPQWRRGLFSINKSIINACEMNSVETNSSKWSSSLGFEKKYWRKSAEWFAIIRSHAELYGAVTKIAPPWHTISASNEHFLPIMLAQRHLENETTCTDGFAHVTWTGKAHPHTFYGSDINASMFDYLKSPIGLNRGFNSECSGVDGICHFTARKFKPSAIYALYDTLSLILSEPGFPYTGNPYRHLQRRLVVYSPDNATSSSAAIQSIYQRLNIDGHRYYLIEHTTLRGIPDTATAAYLRMDLSRALSLNRMLGSGLRTFSVGEPLPSRKPGTLLRSGARGPVTSGLHIVGLDGRRRRFSDYAAFRRAGHDLSKVVVLSDKQFDESIADHSGDTMPARLSLHEDFVLVRRALGSPLLAEAIAGSSIDAVSDAFTPPVVTDVSQLLLAVVIALTFCTAVLRWLVAVYRRNRRDDTPDHVKLGC